MKLTMLKQKLKEYFFPFETYKDAEKYIKSVNYVDVNVNGYTNASYYSSKTRYYLSEDDFKNSCNELIKYYEQHCKALFKCLNIKEEEIIPQIDETRKYGTKDDAITGGLIGGGVGALIGGILGGGLWLITAGLGAAIGSEKNYGDNKLIASCKTLYQNSIVIGEKCVNYFTKIISEMIDKGIVDTFIEPEWALYYVKLICPKCGGRLKAKKGKFGWFMGCLRYPACKYTTKYIHVPKLNQNDNNIASENTDDDLPF